MEATMPGERKPAHRLVTQNLLASAALFEHAPAMDWAAVQDLSAFIDLFCLYDKVAVIGRGAYHGLLDQSSDFFGLIRDAHYVDVEVVKYDKAEAVAEIARKHLATFLGEQEPDRFRELLEFVLGPGQAQYGLSSMPDRSEDVAIGQQWLQTTPTHTDLVRQLEQEKDAVRGTTFLVRTFLYLAYADDAKVAFTPDAIRCLVLETVLDVEEQFRGRLLAVLRSSFERYPVFGDQELQRRVSPLTAIVFERATPKPERITGEMEKLRDELAPFRRRLHELEDKALWASRDEAVDASRRWEDMLAELERSFGAEPGLVSVRRGLNFAESAAKVIEQPTSWTAWSGALLSLPAEVISRVLSRRPAIEIHRLRRQLPATGRLHNTIHRLFGEINL
jgi:hypothetical protein